MSIKIMSMVWEHGPADKAETLILLALSDFCNDKGECWPAVASIARKARMTERGAQKIIARLVESGWLEIEPGGGRRNCNLYTVINPERGSPRTPFTPNTVTETPNPVPKNPEPRSPEPSLNHQEPSVSDDTNVSSRRLSPEHGFDDFWGLWPSKKNKDAARKAWRRLSMDDKRAAYRAVQRGWLDAWQREHPDANPIHASTFLNKRRWEDEPAPSKPTPAKGAQANAKPSITERIFPRDRGMDCGPGRNPSEPLLPPDDGRRDRGSGDDGLDRGALRLVSGTDKRGM